MLYVGTCNTCIKYRGIPIMYNANLKENLISVGTFKLNLYVRMYLPIFEQMNTNSS